jgi:hypothetical protein
MKSHRTINKQLYEFLRGELSEQQRKDTESHLSGCSRCSSELESLREATSLLEKNVHRPSEFRNELYWQHFADKVDRRIESDVQNAKDESIIQQILEAFTQHRKPFGIGFASALTIVMIAFGVWRMWLRNPEVQELASNQSTQQTATHASESVQKVSMDLRAQDYLEESKVLLIGLMNTDTKSLASSGMLLEREQEISRKLVAESGDIASKLNDPSQRRMKELISDLQLILIQIANLGTHRDVPGVEIIKGGIEHNDILFKINLEEIQRTSKSVPKNEKSLHKTI